MFPVNLRVVLLQPHKPQNHLVFAKIHYFGCHLLMMTLVGNGDIHTVGNVTGRVLGAINIEDRNSMVQGPEGELLFLSPSFVNEDHICAAV